MNELIVDKSILRSRFETLGWTEYRLAKETSRVRAEQLGEKEKSPSSLVTSVSKVIENPNTSQFKNVEAVIKAMGGELVIRWPQVEVVSHEEVKL
ncbi:hypothetical protein N836_09555 [Leptolyngbya sp. Heron Island J]|uniref:hypothetical protein n=1 Tax=Leptolyngbya sp. Heron Island J TaxID=1385935 RepID=UPI0003B9663E|nr:hypothetical protein [Leptolyngbya sp. Heron Island J]ESA35955.1 hypothetical protein N836_09555 [Leptolyngbya sp. Heron Island J]